MKVAFSEITAKGLHKVVENTGSFVDVGNVIKVLPVADIALFLVNESTAKLNGTIKAVVDLNCSRCGQPVAFELYADYDYIFKIGEDSSLHKKDVECGDEDCCIVYLDEPIIDIDEILQEQLALSIPVKLLCSEDCKGLCHKCGELLATGRCSCVEDNSDSPFAVLKNL